MASSSSAGVVEIVDDREIVAVLAALPAFLAHVRSGIERTAGAYDAFVGKPGACAEMVLLAAPGAGTHATPGFPAYFSGHWDLPTTLQALRPVAEVVLPLLRREKASLLVPALDAITAFCHTLAFSTADMAAQSPQALEDLHVIITALTEGPTPPPFKALATGSICILPVRIVLMMLAERVLRSIYHSALAAWDQINVSLGVRGKIEELLVTEDLRRLLALDTPNLAVLAVAFSMPEVQAALAAIGVRLLAPSVSWAELQHVDRELFTFTDGWESWAAATVRFLRDKAECYFAALEPVLSNPEPRAALRAAAPLLSRNTSELVTCRRVPARQPDRVVRSIEHEMFLRAPSEMVGRAKELAACVGHLRFTGRVAVIRGEPGTGKSLLAYKTARELARAGAVGLCLTVQATDADTVRASLERAVAPLLAPDEPAPEGPALVQRFWTVVQQVTVNVGCLVVVDNVVDPEAMLPFLLGPATHLSSLASLLITTCSAAVHAHPLLCYKASGPVLDVTLDQLHPAEACQLLLATLEARHKGSPWFEMARAEIETNAPVIGRLIELEFGCQPTAVCLAGRLLGTLGPSSDPPVTVEWFLRGGYRSNMAGVSGSGMAAAAAAIGVDEDEDEDGREYERQAMDLDAAAASSASVAAVAAAAGVTADSGGDGSISDLFAYALNYLDFVAPGAAKVRVAARRVLLALGVWNMDNALQDETSPYTRTARMLAACAGDLEDVLFNLQTCGLLDAAGNLHALLRPFATQVALDAADDPEIVWGAVAQACALSANAAQADRIFVCMRTAGVQPSIIILNILLKAYANAGNLDRMDACMAEIRTAGVVPDAVTYGTLLRAFGKDRRRTAAYLAEMKAQNVAVDAVIFNTRLKALGEARDWQGLEECAAEMRAARIAPTEATLNTVLKAYGDAGEIEQMEAWLARVRVAPNIVTFNTLLQAYGAIRDMAKMDTVLSQMQVSGVEPTSVTFATRLRTYGEARDRARLEACVEEMHGSYLAPDVVIYNILLKAYSDVRDLRRVDDLFEEMKHAAVVPNEVTFGTLLKAYADARSTRKVEACLAEMRTLGLRPNAIAYNTLIKAACDAGDLVKMQSVYRSMCDAGVAPTDVTFNIMLQAYGAEQDQRGMDECLEEMRVAGFSPDAVTVATLVKVNAKDIRKVAALQAEMKGVALDDVAYNNMINAFGASGDLARMEDCFAEMKAAGVRPTSVTFSIMLKFYGERRDTRRSEALLHEMREARVAPDASLFSTLIKDAGEPAKVERLMREMLDSGTVPNDVVFNTALKAYGDARDLRRLEGCLADMHAARVAPNDVTFNTLIAAYFRANRIPEATAQLAAMREYGCEPDSFSYGPLLRHWATRPDEAQLRRLLDDMCAHRVLLTKFCWEQVHVCGGHALVREYESRLGVRAADAPVRPPRQARMTGTAAGGRRGAGRLSSASGASAGGTASMSYAAATRAPHSTSSGAWARPSDEAESGRMEMDVDEGSWHRQHQYRRRHDDLGDERHPRFDEHFYRGGHDDQSADRRREPHHQRRDPHRHPHSHGDVDDDGGDHGRHRQHDRRRREDDEDRLRESRKRKEAPEDEMEVCQLFRRGGSAACRRGKSCRFAHVVSDQPYMPTEPCRKFQQGTCTRGAGCRFSHAAPHHQY